MSEPKLWAATVTVVLVSATLSVSAAPPPGVEPPKEIVEKPPVGTAGIPAALAVAAAAAAFGAYGWIANKSYDLGKSVGRSQALKEAQSKQVDVRTGGLYIDDRYEILLD